MAALNEAWWVLRDPGRRREYDRSLDGVPSPAGAATPGPGTPGRVPGGSDHGPPPRPGEHLVRGLPWVAAVVVLAAIFVFTAFAAGTRPDGPPAGVDGLVDVGSCVVYEGTGPVAETPCEGRFDGIVEVIRPASSPCPQGTESHSAPNTGGLRVCVRPI